MRRFFYISWISGKTLNGIKQTSFNLIDAISKNKDINMIKNMLDKFIYEKNLIRNLYENLEGNVYGENYLKPLLLSIEYEIRESTNTTFYKIDSNIHIDHILPQHFDKKINEWKNIENIEYAKKELDKLGNMALLQNVKNLEALNMGFENKIKIYQGKDNKNSGITSFDTTKKIIDNYNEGDHLWDVNHIKDRYTYLITQIENILDITKEDIVDSTENERIIEKYDDVEDMLYLSVDNVIYGKGYYKDGKMIVLAGSKVRKIESPDPNMREKVINGRKNINIVDGEYIKNTEYDTPSYAANIILGNHKNGWIAWKNEQKVTLNDLVGRGHAKNTTKKDYEII